ncbi:MAG: YdcF family protein [Planctomycetes bacterium]|nr:YdcF family protein [Planctomycetota bacterium]
MSMLREILPLFVMPSVIVPALLIAGFFTKKRWPVIAALALLLISSLPVASDGLMRAVEGYRARQAIAAAPVADAIVVLSQGVLAVPGDSGAMEFGEFDRFLGGFDLYRAGKAPRLIFTGGWSAWSPNTPLVGDVLMSRARDFGIPGTALSTTGKVSNTEQEASAVATLLGAAPMSTPGDSATSALESFGNARAGAPRILLVTSAYHMGRAEKLFRKAGLSVHSFPVDFQTPPLDAITLRSFIPSGGALHQTEMALHEVMGSLYDALTR